MSELHHHLCLALDAISDPIFLLDEGGECVWSNYAFLQFLGREDTDNRAPTVATFWPGIGALDEMEGELSAELRSAVHAGLVSVKISISRFKGVFALCRVITNPSRQKQFHAQRLETLGMLAGGIAHDFNNVLAGILGHITYLKTILPDAGPHTESLDAIEEGGKKASLMTQQILNFSKLDTTDTRGSVDLCELVVKTCGLLRGAISPEFGLSYEIPEEAVLVRSVEGKLAQVLVNLAMNSRDALSSGGAIGISVATVEDATELAECVASTSFTGEAPSEWAVLRVSDDGAGMNEEVLSRVYEPYFSTKEDKGTGLGLSTVISIVNSCDGTIRINSFPDAGTTVSVFLPKIAQEKIDTEVPETVQREELPSGSERILVVDDEDPVRNVLCVSLVHLGYDVSIASSGAEALELMSNAELPFDLVILDMLMPNLSGDEVFFRMKELNHSVRVLVISGYSSEEAVELILDNGGLGFLQKPFTIEDLSTQVRHCLDVSLDVLEAE